LGKGQLVPVETLSKMMRPYDADGKGGLSRAEYAQFLADHGVGGKWFCDLITRSTWQSIEAFFMDPILWIKVEAIAQAIHEFMKMKPRLAKRVHITPESAQGYEPMYYLDGTPVVPGSGPVKPPFTAPPAAPVTPQSRVRGPAEPFTKSPVQARAPITVPNRASVGGPGPRAPASAPPAGTAPRAPVTALRAPVAAPRPQSVSSASGPSPGSLGPPTPPANRAAPAMPRRPGPRR
jgi:hypothetical protein